LKIRAHGSRVEDWKSTEFRKTGKTASLRYTAAQDAGTAIHPAYMEGQIQGASAGGLNEEHIYDEDSHLLNATLLDLGEVSIIPPPAAPANALHRATSVRMYTLPMSPARVMKSGSRPCTVT
jgi:CO/xanthine dehydrogenase Mo-binding subunit